MENKKVVFLIINSLNGGGAEHVAARLSSMWSQDYELKVISLMPFTDNDYAFSGELISICDYYKGNNWITKIHNASKKIDELADKYKPSTMISFLQNANLCLMFTKFNCKKIVSIRNYIDYQYHGIKKIIWRLLVKKYFKKADYVVSVSKLINKEMNEKYKIPKEKCVCIYNPYDSHAIENMAKEELNDEERRFFDNCYVIANLGHVSKQKGQIKLIKILPYLVKKDKDIKLVIIGDNNNDYARKLERIAKQNGILDNIYFTGINKNPYKYLAKSSVFVFPSLYEGFPNALVEAMICGVPTIANDCKSGPKEILDPDNNIKIKEVCYGKYGILIPHDYENKDIGNMKINNISKQEANIIKAIEKLFDNTEFANMYSNRGTYRAKEFSINEINKQWEEIIEGKK